MRQGATVAQGAIATSYFCMHVANDVAKMGACMSFFFYYVCMHVYARLS